MPIMLRALLCRVVLIAALAGARSPKRAKTAGSAAPRLRGTAPHLLYAQRPPPASSEEALVLSLHEFGATTWRPPMATRASLSRAERAYWSEGLANVKAKFEGFEPLTDRPAEGIVRSPFSACTQQYV